MLITRAQLDDSTSTTDEYESSNDNKNNSLYYNLPDDYFAYIRSNSEILSTITPHQSNKRV
jgi:hypothetical protein